VSEKKHTFAQASAQPMGLEGPEGLTARSEAFDRRVAETEGVDRFCSSTDWVLPAHAAFHAEHVPWVYQAGDGFVALAQGLSPTVGRYLAPLEAMWGLATPFVGADQATVTAAAIVELERRADEWDTLWLSGLNRQSVSFALLVRHFGRSYRLGLGPTTKRHSASLAGGFDGFMGRRSAKFRANLRRAQRAAAAAGITFEVGPRRGAAEAAAALHARAMAVEARSWKGLSGQGVNQGSMLPFYGHMLPRVMARGGLRCLFARRGGEDVAFLFGAVTGATFRGLQVSFDDRYRALSLGNVMQAAMIERLCEEGLGWYDLGSDLPYKARWSEEGLVTGTLAVVK
jgi:hypothetical protein